MAFPGVSMAITREMLRVKTLPNGAPADAAQIEKIGSNRMVVSLSTKNIEGGTTVKTSVVRGRSLPMTLVVAAMICEQIQKWGAMNNDNAIKGLTDAYEDEVRNNPVADPENDWITVYTGGEPVFASRKSAVLDLIENLARGRNVDAIIEAASSRMQKPGHQVTLEFDEQLAFTLSETDHGAKTAILDRMFGKAGAMRFVLAWDKMKGDRTRDKIIALRCASAIAEGSALVSEFNRLTGKIQTDSSLKSDPNIIDRIKKIFARVNAMQARIDIISRQRELDVTPRKPNFMGMLEYIPGMNLKAPTPAPAPAAQQAT
ncbi:MAG: hypothetical protein JNK11_01380 [Alphaproteobacteria bacterium]|nr:hypothetical protein [Alphaproteobacteria bacterium]